MTLTSRQLALPLGPAPGSGVCASLRLCIKQVSAGDAEVSLLDRFWRRSETVPGAARFFSASSSLSGATFVRCNQEKSGRKEFS